MTDTVRILRVRSVTSLCREHFGRAALACLLLAALAARLSAAVPDTVQLELTPNAVQVAPGEADQILLVVRNEGASAIGGLKLHWSGDPAVTVLPQHPLQSTVEPHSAVAETLTLSRALQGRGVGKLNFWITWGGSPESGRQVAVAAVDVQDRSFLSIDKLATIRLEAAVDHLDENQSATLYIVVSNTSPVPITIHGIQPFGPKFIELKTPPIGGGVVLGPQESRTFSVEAKVTDQALAGNQRVVIQADLAWTENGIPRTGTLSVAQTLPVTIFGESDLLKVLGVPSFLFLPGFLFLTTFHLLWTRVSPRIKVADSATTSETALISVSLSFFAILIYPWATHRNYLHGYGVRDVMNVWFGSIVIALAIWCLVAGIRLIAMFTRNYFARRAAERAAQENEERIRVKTPTKDDSPLEILQRMCLVGMSAPAEQAKVSLDGSRSARCFVVMHPAEENQQYWVTPPIVLRSKKEIVSPWSRVEIAAQLEQPNRTGSYEQLHSFLDSVQNAGWTVAWGESGAIYGPTPVADLKIEDRAQGFEFVQFAT